MTDRAAKLEPSTTEPSADDTTEAVDPANVLNPLTTVASAPEEELHVMKCLNPQEAVAHEKHLQDLVKKALRQFMKGLNADPDDQPLPEVMLTLVKDFKKAIMKVHDLVKQANHEGVMECIKDPEANCIWDRSPNE